MSRQDLMRTRSSNLRLNHEEKEEIELKQSELTSSNLEFDTEQLFNTITNKKKTKNITSHHNIYTTANISAFASLLSLLALVLGIITIMLTHEKSLLTTMKTSYEFMKQLSDGWNKGIRELQIKTGGDNIDMTMQLSEFVQTMHKLPWRQLRENIKEEQLEEFFKILADVPDKFDKVQDMAWSICVELRRLLGFTTDFCIPSKRHSPSKVIISFKDIGNHQNIQSQDLMLINQLKGQYLEKGLTQLMENWFKSTRDQIVYLQPMNHNEYEILSNHDTLKSYSTLSSKFLIEPRVFEKLMIHQRNENEAPFDLLYGTDMVLITRGGILYNDYNWHIDRIRIENIYTFPINNIMYNPTQLSSGDNIRILVKSLNFRNPAIDTFSEYHIFNLKDYENIIIDDIVDLGDMIKYEYYESPFIENGQTDKYYQREIARKNTIIMDRINQEWKIFYNSNHCSFKSKMDSELHKKISWHFCWIDQQKKQQQQQHQVSPIIFINEIYVWVDNNIRATGIYKRIDNPFQTGYFTPIHPNPKYIFVKQDEFESTKIYRLYMGKHPNYQWYLESFQTQPIAISNCRLSLQRIHGNNVNLCQHIPPYKHWHSNNPDVFNAEIINHLRAITVEFNYLSDRIYSIYLIYKNDKLLSSDDNAISLKPEITIKGNDMYFNIFTKKDDNNLDKHYNQITLDLKTLDAMNIKEFCDPSIGSETALPTIHLINYQGKVEAIGGHIFDGKFIITFYSIDDCRNLMNTVTINAKPFDFKN